MPCGNRCIGYSVQFESGCGQQDTHLIERDLRARDDGDNDGVERPESGPASTLRDKGEAETLARGDERETVDVVRRKLRCLFLSARRCCGEQQEQEEGEEESDREDGGWGNMGDTGTEEGPGAEACV